MFVLIVGTLGDGFNFYGPFNSTEEAVKFAEQFKNIPWEIAEMTKGVILLDRID